MSRNNIKEKIEKYKRKHYLRQLSKGVLITLITFIILFSSFNGLESLFWFDSLVRLILLLGIIGAFLIPFTLLVIIPLLELFHLKNGLSDKQIAKDIGKLFPEINDKLLNLLELEKLDRHEKSLITASIDQRMSKMQSVDFSAAIKLSVNNRYVYFLISAICVFGLFSFIHPINIRESTKRIIFFQNDFEKPMPFKIQVENESLTAYKNEDFKLKIIVEGSSIPESIYLINEGSRKIKLNQGTDNQSFTYVFYNVQKPNTFRLEAAGFLTKSYDLKLITRPEISDFLLKLDYPDYTKLEDTKIKNIGDATVPEGTTISWELNTINTTEAKLIFKSDTINLESVDNQLFKSIKKINTPQKYEIKLSNIDGANKNPIFYDLDVIKDLRPEISIQFLADSIYFTSIAITGKIEDDYGFSKLALFEKSLTTGETYSSVIPFNKNLVQSSFFHTWNSSDSRFSQDEEIEIWVTVSDNDQINGPKSTSSEKYYYKRPSDSEINKIIKEKSQVTENSLSGTQQESTQLKEQIEDLQNRLKNKNELGWQEQKMAQEIIDKKNEIEKSIEELKKQHAELLSSETKFDKKGERIAEKSKQLQQLMEELLDDETKALYDELQKLLEEKSSLDEVSEQLSKISPSEANLEKELERALEHFKRLKLETKMEQTSSKLEELADKQTSLANEEQSDNSQQSEINQSFEEIKEDIKEIEKLNQDLEEPEPLENFDEQEGEISEDLKEISEELQKNGDNKKTKSKQQNAGNKMKEMAGRMQQMQSNMESEMMEENMENLRDILDNLVKGSFEQERIIQSFKGVSQVDPRFIELSQDQLQLVENTKITEDSLRSLAKRVLQISNFVTREIDQINRSLDNALIAIKDRDKNNATVHQQFAMTSMNNLALLLDDVMQQMQAAMSKGGGEGSKKGKKKGGKPSMSELQKQLSQQIKELKQSGSSGRQLSEELARMAAEQARIREELQNLQDKLAGQKDGGEESGQGLKEAIEKMEQNEVDLVNKRLTQNLINRQEEIISRMLQAEKSMREQEQDQERKGETAKSIKNDYPPAFEEYLKARQSEIELLNSIPLDLSPFYKKEVNKYFRELSIQKN